LPECECGCGVDAGTYRSSFSRGGTRFRKGSPRRFLRGHSGGGAGGFWGRGPRAGFQIGHPGPQLLGEDNPAWRGDAVSYGGLHRWINRHRPKSGTCEKCGTEGYTENANLSGEYRRDLEDWMEMCKPCHQEYDDRPKESEAPVA